MRAPNPSWLPDCHTPNAVPPGSRAGAIVPNEVPPGSRASAIVPNSPTRMGATSTSPPFSRIFAAVAGASGEALWIHPFRCAIYLLLPVRAEPGPTTERATPRSTRSCGRSRNWSAVACVWSGERFRIAAASSGAMTEK